MKGLGSEIGDMEISSINTYGSIIRVPKTKKPLKAGQIVTWWGKKVKPLEKGGKIFGCGVVWNVVNDNEVDIVQRFDITLQKKT